MSVCVSGIDVVTYLEKLEEGGVQKANMQDGYCRTDASGIKTYLDKKFIDITTSLYPIPLRSFISFAHLIDHASRPSCSRFFKARRSPQWRVDRLQADIRLLTRIISTYERTVTIWIEFTFESTEKMAVCCSGSPRSSSPGSNHSFARNDCAQPRSQRSGEIE